MASSAVNKLERVRRLARDIGVPLDTVEKLALSIPRAAMLIDLDARTLRKALDADGIQIIRIHNLDRIYVVDFVEFLERHRVSRRDHRKKKTRWDLLSTEQQAALKKAGQPSRKRREG